MKNLKGIFNLKMGIRWPMAKKVEQNIKMQKSFACRQKFSRFKWLWMARSVITDYEVLHIGF